MMKSTYRKIYSVLGYRVLKYLDSYNAKQISELIYSYARMHEKNLLLFARCAPIIISKLGQYSAIELVNIYWGFASARFLDDKLCTILEAAIIAQAPKVSTEGLIQFFHSMGIFARPVTEEVNQFILNKLTNIPALKLTIQQHFALAYSLMLLQGKQGAYGMIWEQLLNGILT